MATLEQQVEDQQRTDVCKLLQQGMQERHQMEKQHFSKYFEFVRKIVKQKEETEKARKDVKEAMKRSFTNVSEMERLGFKNITCTLLLCTLVYVCTFANFREAECFHPSVLAALSSYVLPLLGLIYIWCCERCRKRKTSEELAEAAMRECQPHIEKMWADPGCVDGLQQEVGHLQAQLPAAHLLESKGLETTKYPELLARALRAETNLQQEHHHNQNLQARLQQEYGRNEALQRELRSEQERTTSALKAVADRPNVVNNISNDNRTWNHTSTSYDYRRYDYRSYDYRSYDYSSYNDNREYRSVSNHYDDNRQYRSITNHFEDNRQYRSVTNHFEDNRVGNFLFRALL